jgi:hypothetical protein
MHGTKRLHLLLLVLTQVVPTTADMLHMPLEAALAMPEPLWEQPRTLDAAQGGGWGSQRVALFSGLRLVPPQGTSVALLLRYERKAPVFQPALRPQKLEQ